MIKILKVKLNLPENLNTQNISSLLHGVIIEQLSVELQDKLHTSSRYSPLKQRLYYNDTNVIWEIVSFDSDLSIELDHFINSNGNIFIKYHNIKVDYEVIISEEIDEKQMMNDVYDSSENINIFKINFISPTSHKSSGEYDIFPDIEKLFRSIMRNYDSFNYDNMYDGEALDQIVECTKIIDYRLKSTRFHLENTRIPAFRGMIILKVKGNIHFKKLIKFLLKYGEYSGVGIKTSLGMGKYTVED